MENKKLLELMEKCGHFLYHRRGGRCGQAKMLAVINARGEVTQKELMQALSLKSGTVSEVVSKLENKGLVCKVRSESDRRKLCITITPSGKELLKERLAVMHRQESVLFTALDKEEQTELERLLSKLFDDWKGKFDGELFAPHGREE